MSAVRRRSLPYTLLLPAALALVVALGYPLVRQVVLSFQEYGLAQQFGQPATWVGLQNYTDLFTDSYLWTVVVRSLVFCFVNAGLTMAIGIAVARNFIGLDPDATGTATYSSNQYLASLAPNNTVKIAQGAPMAVPRRLCFARRAPDSQTDDEIDPRGAGCGSRGPRSGR